jgi:putative ABC transport system permease protein
MIQNYFKVAARNIVKRKTYSFINAFGLSIGIAFCTLIFLYIQDERSFDQFHVNKNLIYRIEEKSYDTWQQEPGKEYNRSAWLQTGLKQAIKDEIPEVQLGTRFNSGSDGIFRANEKVFTEKLCYVDGDFFKMFSFKLLSGNPDKLFANRSDLVLTPAIAKKYFGDEDPLGKTVLIDDEGEKSFTVVGIIEAPPANSSLDFQILLPQENRPRYDRNMTQWGSFNTPTFVQLVPNTDLEKFSVNLDKMLQKVMGDRLKKWREKATVPIPDNVKLVELVFTQLPDIHLKKELSWHKVSDPQYSLILGGIALLILMIACINYVSLSLTTSTARRTEVGIRKVVGAQRKQLVYQFGFESIILAIGSMVIGIGLVFLFLPAFNAFTDKGIVVAGLNLFQLIGVSTLVTLLVGAVAGSYPALFLSGFRPALVLKGGFTSRLHAGFTRPLVVLQFALSAFLIISSVIMYRQMRFVTTKDLGYNKEQIVVVPTQTGWNPDADKTVQRFRIRAQQEPSILSVSGTTSSFNRGYSRYGYKIKGEQKSSWVYGVDPYYLPTLGIELVQGRNFDEHIASDSSSIIVNEALVRDMKWTDPLNEYLNWQEDTVGLGSRIIGVVKDYHFRSLEQDIEPMFMSMDKKNVGYLVDMVIKIAPGDIPGSIAKIHQAWKDVSPDKPFDYTFLDEDVAKQYKSYQRWMSIMGLATGFAILISCLGLFGLAGINAVNKTREIGIRKVMGADLQSIFVLLNRQYVWLSLIAFSLAAPLSYYVMTKWLDDFKFKVAIGWELFAVSMASGLIIALMTVSYHAIRVSLVNPAETLKYE